MHLDDHQFSEREKDVVGHLLRGKSNKQIALELGIANRTVEFHLSNIYARLGVSTRSEAILKLTDSRLRESTGGEPVNSTVDHSGDSTENGITFILRRIPVKSLYLLLGGLLATTLIAFLVLALASAKNPASDSFAHTTQANGTNFAVVPTPAVETQKATETSPASPITIQPSPIVIPPHTVNGYTAAIESYYVDSSHIIFQVRLTGGEMTFGDENYYSRIESPDILDENGMTINTSGGWGPAVDPALYHFEFVPVTLLKGDRLKGQFAFEVTNAPEYEEILARFRFDFDLPIYPDVRFHPKKTIAANGIEILLDSITITPAYTQIYVCFPSPSFADWNIGHQTVLEIDNQQANPEYFRLLFDSALGGDRTAGSEPYWVPPVKNGRCIKSGFPIGSTTPASVTLTIPDLEKSAPDILLTNQLSVNYPGLNPGQAYYTYLDEHGFVYRGAWIYEVELSQ